MIVRDAEETVGRAIKSALAVVDEVVVVDTGSADNTRLIVEGYGARVVEHDWNDDFAAARNAGIEAAYGDWILVLDADEILESIRPVEVGRLLSNDAAIGYQVQIREVDDEGRSTVVERVRLFRNHARARYRFPVYEEVTPALADLAEEQGREFRASRLRIRHHVGSGSQSQVRRSRNLRLLQRAISESPEEPWFGYQLACAQTVRHEDRTLPVKGFSSTLELLERAVEQVRAAGASRAHALGYVPDLFCRYADALLAADRIAESVAAAEEAQRICGDAPLIRYTHARALVSRAVALDDAAERDALLTIASAHLRVLLNGPPARGSAPVSERYFGVYPRVMLGHVELARGDAEAAGESFRRAMRACPDQTAALGGLGLIARSEGRVHDALQIFMKIIAVDPLDPDAWIGGVEAQIELGFEHNARSWIGRFEQAMPEHPRLPSLSARLASAATAGS
jgi:tetratricopeptide (TPR) repeat protein